MNESNSESQRFFDPDYIPDADTIKAVRILISDWQGDNKAAVHHALRQMGYPRDEIDAMTGMDVRMAFCNAPVMLKIDKRVETTTGQITAIDFGQSKPDTHKRGRPSVFDPKQDARWAAAWASGNHATYADCARELGIDEDDLRAAIGRHRKRPGAPE